MPAPPGPSPCAFAVTCRPTYATIGPARRRRDPRKAIPAMIATETTPSLPEFTAFPVCDEFPVQLELNGERIVTLLCTPSGLTELAVGWLYCEGLIDGVDELLAVGGCDQLSRMRVFTDSQRPLVQSEWRRVITSGCGSGHAIDPQ